MKKNIAFSKLPLKTEVFRGFLQALILFCLLCFGSFAEPYEIQGFVSPNNDGVQDELEIPLRIVEKRYVTFWALHILDADGNTVRTIENKNVLPEKMTAGEFFKRLVTPKQGVDVPETVTWNGAMDDGKTAPDGVYTYYAEAMDDNGNKSRTPNYTVTVDTRAPEIALIEPKDKIFGGGKKAELEIKQAGSAEDRWTANIRSAGGKIIRSYVFQGEPQSFSWDGTDDYGSFVPDGVYYYEISSVDRAGNASMPASIQNIIFSAEKPEADIAINGSRYFSPETSSEQSSVLLDVLISEPSFMLNRLTNWSVEIVDATEEKIPHKVYDSTQFDTPPEKIEFDGKDLHGIKLPDGLYQARVTAEYLNGYETPVIYSPIFVIDTSKPEAHTNVSDKVFGAGDKTSVTISQNVVPKEFAPVASWTGKIFSTSDTARENPVRTFLLGEEPPEAVVWDGYSEEGELSATGDYFYEISAIDMAGNEARIDSDVFTLDTSQAQVLLSVREPAFSPNGDGEKDTAVFMPVLQTGAGGVESYVFTVTSQNGDVVRTQKGFQVPDSIVWNGRKDDGKIAEDGSYVATLQIVSANGSEASMTTQPFSLDTAAPFAETDMPWKVFSPDESSRQKSVAINISECSPEALWKATVLDIAETPVRHFTWSGPIQTDGAAVFEWDGTDDAGNVVPDGDYSILLESEDAAGNKFSKLLENITLDAREVRVFLEREHDGISPNNDGFLENQIFTVRLIVPDGISAWRFDIYDEYGIVARSFEDEGRHHVPYTIVWDGLDANGNLCEGTFMGVFSASYEKGNDLYAVSAPFVCTATPPVLDVTTAPEYFSPDNDGIDDDLFINLRAFTKAAVSNWSFVINDPNGKVFWHTEGSASITEKITWDGLSNTQLDSEGFAERVQSAVDYPWIFTVEDSVGMKSTIEGVIPVDVLVIRDGNVLKMAVPSIIFRSDHADFKVESYPGRGDGVTVSQAANNERVLNRVAEILNKFRDYKVTIVGHANKMTAYQDEETVDNPRIWGRALIPLSKERSEFVRAYLIRHGVSASRLSTDGMGGMEPVADWRDLDNRWKNRRVEFILHK